MDKTEEEVFLVCQKAQIHDFILTFPNGYGTVIGEKSDIMLSDGEKQRIAIARALLKDTQFLVLDEGQLVE